MSTEGSGASRAAGDGLHNEDVFVVEPGLGLYLVCDGASGAPAGEAAARIASEAIEAFVERADEEIDLGGSRASLAVVERAMRYALGCVLDSDELTPGPGLLTTATLLLAHGRTGVIGHCGDSRAYLVRQDRCHQLTRDHELTEESAGGGEVPFDVFRVDLHAGDTVILCTDGAEDVVQNREIVRAASRLAPRVLASRIVSVANREHSDQDATAVVVRVQHERDPGWLGVSEPTRGTSYGHTLEHASRPA